MIFFDDKKVKAIEKGLKKSFKSIKGEIEDHLDSINENTNEIQTNYEYLCEIDQKIHKLNERFDEFQYVLETLVDRKSHKFTVKEKLSFHEQQVFLLLYTLSANRTLTFPELSKRLKLSVKAIGEHLDNLDKKGIPIKKIDVNGQVGLHITEEFKAYQAKNNVVKISEKLVNYLNL